MKRRHSLSFGAWLLFLIFASRFDAPGNDVGTASDPVVALRQIIEEQNRRIDALSQKVLQLEHRVRESESRAQPAPEVLPTIVIDTNGVPITPAVAPNPAPSLVGATSSSATTPTNEPAVAAPPQLRIGSEGFALQSGDKNFVLRLRGLLQVDSRTFFDDSPLADGNDGFVLRRARPIVEGTVFRDFDFRVAPDFAPSTPQLFDAHLNYRLRPEFQLRAGKIKPPIGLEQLQSDSYGLFNERSLPTQLVPVRSVGAQFWGQIDAGSITYAVGGFGSNGDARNAPNLSIADQPEFAGRVFAEPWRNSDAPLLQGFGVGLGGSYSQIRSNAAALPSTLGGDHPGYLTTGSQQFFAYNPAAGQVVADGTHWRLAPQVSWRFGSFGLMGEYHVTEQGVLNATTLRSAHLQHQAWQCSAQWVLTGEPASFEVIQPLRPFDWSQRGWGAWQLVGRLGQMRLDSGVLSGILQPGHLGPHRDGLVRRRQLVAQPQCPTSTQLFANHVRRRRWNSESLGSNDVHSSRHHHPTGRTRAHDPDATGILTGTARKGGSTQPRPIGRLTLLVWAASLVLTGIAAPSPSSTRRPPTFAIDRYQVLGNQALDEARIREAFSDASGPAVTVEQIGVGMARLRRFYCESGYPAVRLSLPQQVLRDRTVQIEVDEGPRSPIPQPSTARSVSFEVRTYQVVGNSLLSQEMLDAVFSPATGPSVTLDQVRRAAGQLQLAYRERGYMTVGVGIPPQQITNGTLRVQVTEGTLTDIRVTGERHFSSNNVRRALPSLRHHEVPNSRILQRELDLANQNPDRQIFPMFGPGPEPGTSSLTLRVEDRRPLHGRIEVNNLSTPETPEWRINTSVQYLNLWQLEHQFGLSYGFSPEAYKPGDLDGGFPLNHPQIAYYGAFYRMPLGPPGSVADQIAGQPAFGYDEASRQFRLPAPSARPELSVFGSFASSDTGLQSGPATIVTHTPLLTIVSQDTGRNVSENGSAGARLQWPLASGDRQRLALTLGPDWKAYRLESFNTNTFVITTVVTNLQGTQILENRVASPQPTRRYALDYLPMTAGLDFSRSDSRGRTFGSLALAGSAVGDTSDFRAIAYSPSARATYGRALLQAQRDQRLVGDWTAALRLSGQAATGPLISNEQFAVGGVSSVRGYYEGDEYGDAGWFTNLEFRTPWLQRSVAFGSQSAPVRLRGWVFADLGQRWLMDADAAHDVSRTLLGAGAGISANLDQNLDLRLIVGWPLLDTPNTRAGDPRAYFTLGGQF